MDQLRITDKGLLWKQDEGHLCPQSRKDGIVNMCKYPNVSTQSEEKMMLVQARLP